MPLRLQTSSPRELSSAELMFLSFGAVWLVAGKDLRSLQKAKEWVTEKITPSPSA
jgi:hypothetical protein